VAAARKHLDFTQPLEWHGRMGTIPSRLALAIKKQALHLGFDDVGITTADPLERDDGAYQRWLDAGMHASMAWMARSREGRADPRRILSGCQSVVCVAKNHFREVPAEVSRDEGRVARYALGRDYHRVLEKPMRRLAKFIRGLGDGVQTKWCVDTGHVLERGLAARAGLGFQGKNTMLISKRLGSHLFLGEIFTTLALAPDAPEAPHCGTCTRCLEACPTDAFPSPWVLDARRCISHWTIEHRGDLPPDAELHGWVFGCDVCQDVCPWNRFASPTRDPKMAEDEMPATLVLRELAALDEAEFEIRFYGTALSRARREGLMRNAAANLATQAIQE
jgi:epoxyqueuosine reductase